MILSSLRILVVEDHPFQRSTLVRVLAGLGASGILQAADGASALEQLRTASPPVDVIISDLDMPGMDGMEFLRHIGESGHPASVVLMSAVDSTVLAAVEAMGRAYNVRLLGVLPKPLVRARLLDLLRGHVPAGAGPHRQQATRTCTAEEVAAGLSAGEFQPFFQPKVDIATGRLAGFEALARWIAADGTIIPPSAFVGVMEAGGLIDELTWRMLGGAARFGAGLRQSGTHTCMSVNVSAVSLTKEDFVARVTSCVQDAGLESRHMVLEITESVAVGAELGRALETLSRLRLRGFGLSIDDYGTGYSSMQQLGRIPFTELKIDRSFVRNATASHAGMVLLQSCIEVAGKLNLESVAEGVETRDQWDLLARLGCDTAQGYLISAPLPPEQALEWVARNRPWVPAGG